MKTVICHFYNEEYLLPWWLTHHKKMFDHGIMLDYHSTDRSREIIKELCPTWEIRTTRNPNFQAESVDAEVQDIERNITGWRTCLNVTEFLQGDVSKLTDVPNQQLIIPSIIFVDTNREQEVTYDLPLWEQKTYGYTYRTHFADRRGRSIHNSAINYPTPGRHYGHYNTEDFVIFYYGWAPFNEPVLARKLQIQTQIPLIDRQRNLGFQHITTRETLEYLLENEMIPKSFDLTDEIKKHVKN